MVSNALHQDSYYLSANFATTTALPSLIKRKSTFLNLTKSPSYQGHHRFSLAIAMHKTNCGCKAAPTHPPSTPSKQCANVTIKTHPNLPQCIAFYHGALFSPVLTTWIKAQRNHNLDSWPSLSTKQIAKYGPNREATVKGHKQLLCKNIQSTKKHSHPELPLSFGAAAANIEEVAILSNTVQEPKTQWVFIDIQDTTGKIFSDLTGKFVCPSKSGNKYIFILYDHDSNSIHSPAIPSRTVMQLAKAHKSIIKHLTAHSLKPKLVMLDNEVSETVKTLILNLPLLAFTDAIWQSKQFKRAKTMLLPDYVQPTLIFHCTYGMSY